MLEGESPSNHGTPKAESSTERGNPLNISMSRKKRTHSKDDDF
jgi:hypothetical protein